MLRTAARFFLLRFLPRRLLPIVTVVEAIMLVRSLRRRTVRVNEPRDSRTAEPGKPSSRPSPPPRG